MQRKELILVALVALVLTNVSIIGTLALSGYFPAGGKPEYEHDEAAERSAAEPADSPPPTPALHSMSQAMLVCVDKLMISNRQRNIAFDINTVASRYQEDEHAYTIFIETMTPTRIGEPQETAEVICEVDATTMQVAGFKSMKN